MRIIGETDRMQVILDTDSMEITICQRWKIIWCSYRDYDWERYVQKFVKQEIKDNIYKIWNNHAYAIVNTNKGSKFNQNYGKKPFRIKSQIEFVSCGQHWDVKIILNPTETEIEDTSILWNSRMIILNDNVFTGRAGVYYYRQNKKIYARTSEEQNGIAHEFGHTIGNVSTAYYTGDEYTYMPEEYLHPITDTCWYCPIEYISCDHFSLHEDIESIMNIGNELRHRHFAHLRDLLQEMIPGSWFSIQIS